MYVWQGEDVVAVTFGSVVSAAAEFEISRPFVLVPVGRTAYLGLRTTLLSS